MTGAYRAMALTVWVAAALSVSRGVHVLHAQPRSPTVQNRVTLDPAQPVGFHVIVVPDTVYVGQQATYEMGVFITESAQSRMRRNPEVVPAELRGVLAYDLGGPQSLSAIMQHSERVFPHILQRALFPITHGEIVIPPSQLSYSLPRSTSYFSREEAASVRAPQTRLIVKPLPSDSVPVGFVGAVGVLSLRTNTDVASARVGDPLVMTVRVTGRGNVKLWPRPQLAPTTASLITAGERVRVDSSGQYIRGTKEFDWLVTPDREGRLIIPIVEYPYFDPYAERYHIARSDSLTVEIAAGGITPLTDARDQNAALALRPIDRGSVSTPLYLQPVAWALLALLPLPALFWRRRRMRLPADARTLAGGVVSRRDECMADGTLGAPHSARAMDPVRIAASELRRNLLTGLAARLGTTPALLAERRLLEQCLRRRGVTREGTQQALRLLEELDAAAWAPPASATRGTVAPLPASAGRSWADRLRDILQRVDAEALHASSGRSTPSSRAVLGLIFVLSAAIPSASRAEMVTHRLRAQPQTDIGFAEAVALHDGGRFEDASAAFFALAEASPRLADAWANAGTAAWAAHDTARAVLGWQRALRLEPNASDVRLHLARVGQPTDRGPAGVSELSLPVLAALAGLCWCAAWALWAFGSTEPLGALGKRSVFGMLALSVALAAWSAFTVHDRRGSSLWIALSRESLRISPGADADAVTVLHSGEVVIERERRVGAGDGSEWIRVEGANGEGGWTQRRSLLALRE